MGELQSQELMGGMSRMALSLFSLLCSYFCLCLGVWVWLFFFHLKYFMGQLSNPKLANRYQCGLTSTGEHHGALSAKALMLKMWV